MCCAGFSILSARLVGTSGSSAQPVETRLAKADRKKKDIDGKVALGGFDTKPQSYEALSCGNIWFSHDEQLNSSVCHQMYP